MSTDLLDAVEAQPAATIADAAAALEAEDAAGNSDYALVRYDSTSDTTVVTDAMARWSDASTCDTGVPGADDIIVIGEGETVVFDETTTVKGIIVNGGELIIEDGVDLTLGLSSDYVLVMNGGLFQACTEDDPLDIDFTLTLEGDDPDFDLEVSSILRGEVDNTVNAMSTALIADSDASEETVVSDDVVAEEVAAVAETSSDIETTAIDDTSDADTFLMATQDSETSSFDDAVDQVKIGLLDAFQSVEDNVVDLAAYVAELSSNDFSANSFVS